MNNIIDENKYVPFFLEYYSRYNVGYMEAYNSFKSDMVYEKIMRRK